MKITRRQLKQIIKETLTSDDAQPSDWYKENWKKLEWEILRVVKGLGKNPKIRFEEDEVFEAWRAVFGPGSIKTPEYEGIVDRLDDLYFRRPSADSSGGFDLAELEEVVMDKDKKIKSLWDSDPSSSSSTKSKKVKQPTTGVWDDPKDPLRDAHKDAFALEERNKMKITRRQLRQIIKEELGRLNESVEGTSVIPQLSARAEKSSASTDRVLDLARKMQNVKWMSPEWKRMHDEVKEIQAGYADDEGYDEYPKTLGYKHPGPGPETGNQVMISVQSRDDMDDILDPLLRQYPDLPYSVD